MKVRDLRLGDVFRFIDHEVFGTRTRWRKEAHQVREVKARGGRLVRLAAVRSAEVEVVEEGDRSPIRRLGGLLILHDGDVVLRYRGAYRVHRCTPGEKYTSIVLKGKSFWASKAARVTEESALGFQVDEGTARLGRPRGSEVYAYQGRVYARATSQEVTGQKRTGGYKRVVKVDGAPRLTIAGLLTIPDEGALYDIIQDHFGPGAPPA